MKILAIETSCDETAIAILENGVIKENIIASQINFHKEYGGVVPEMSSRMHAETINLLLKKITKKTDLKNIDYVAYTKSPGLIGSLQIGYLVACAIGIALNIKVIPINHLHGHIYAGAITNNYLYPAIATIVSGGHTQIILMKKPYKFEILAETMDDSIGEAFDKVGVVLGLEYPGGPKIDAISKKEFAVIEFPTPAQNNKNFSFSGLKTAVVNYVHNLKQKNTKIPIQEIASSFQQVAIFSIIQKLKKIIKLYEPKSIILSGGVAANSLMRAEFLKLHKNAIIPKLEYCTDNAAMIAKACEIKVTTMEESEWN